MHDSDQKEETGYLPDSRNPGASDGFDEEATLNSSVPAYADDGKARVFIFIMVLASLVGLAFYSLKWKKEVVVRDVVVEGVAVMAGKELSASMKAYKGRNQYELDSDELKARVMQFPYIRDAVISKEMNGIVRIRVMERVVMALTVIDGRNMAIDTEGFLLPDKEEFSEQFPKFLLVSGISRLKVTGNGLRQIDHRDFDTISQFLEALSGSDYAKLLIRELHLAGNNMTYCMANQASTRFIVGNDGNFKEKLKKFEIFWQKVVSKKGFGFYETVDLRFRERVFTRVPVSSEVTQDVHL